MPVGTLVVVPGIPQRSVPFSKLNTLSKKPMVGDRMAAVRLRSSSSVSGTPSSSVPPLL